MQIRKIRVIEILLLVYLFYIYFYQLIDIFGGALFSYSSLVIPSFLIVTLYLILNAGKINRYHFNFFIGWWIISIFVLFYNASFAHGIYFDSIRLLVVVILTFALMSIDYWEYSAVKIMIALGFVHVIATVVFFLSNDIFADVILPLFEYPPVGSNNGIEGYHSGLTDHYSLNGTYCGVTAIIIGSQIISDSATRQKSKLYRIILFCLAFIALLLTSKRAHLVFSVISLAVVYYVVNPEKKSNRIFKLMVLAMIVMFGVAILIESGSPLATVFIRFTQNSGGDISNGRFIMWLLAIKEFINKPLLGIGWQGYRYAYAENLYVAGNYAGGEYLSEYMYLDTHNVYLQVLCETGLVGFVFFALALITPLIGACRMVQQRLLDKQDGVNLLAFSIGIQVFMLLYCFTGCCINDITFLIYMMSVAVYGSLNLKEKILSRGM